MITKNSPVPLFPVIEWVWRASANNHLFFSFRLCAEGWSRNVKSLNKHATTFNFRLCIDGWSRIFKKLSRHVTIVISAFVLKGDREMMGDRRDGPKGEQEGWSRNEGWSRTAKSLVSAWFFWAGRVIEKSRVTSPFGLQPVFLLATHRCWMEIWKKSRF